MSKFVLEIEQSPVLHTKWGKAKLQKNGYYRIKTRKEGYHGKYLHRLIFEENFGPLNSDEVAHHKNECKNDNCIYNMQRMTISEHESYHNSGVKHPMYGKKHSDETKAKMRANHRDNSGSKNSQSKYHNFWNNSEAEFLKRELFSKKGDLRKAFRLRYNGKPVNCGLFIDPLSCEIISDMIKKECEE